MSPPRTRLKSSTSDEAFGANPDNARKRKHCEADTSFLLSEIDTLKSVCNNTLRSVVDLKMMIEQLLNENNSIKTELSLFKSLYASATAERDKNHNNIVDKLQKLTPASVQTPSFASVVQSNPVVVIKPKNVNQPSEATKKDLRENMSPTSSKFCGMRNVANGGVLIECESEDGSNKLLEDAAIKLGENYIVTIPNKRPTKIRIVGMSEQYSTEKLVEKMVTQNPELFHTGHSVEVVSTFKVKTRFGAKVVVDSDSFANLIAGSKLRIGWDICHVYEAFDVVRCYNCSGYHHLAKNCTLKKTCPKCSGEHTLVECNSTIERCCNCTEAAIALNLALGTDHSALSSDCPVYIRKINAQRRRTNYNK